MPCSRRVYTILLFDVYVEIKGDPDLKAYRLFVKPEEESMEEVLNDFCCEAICGLDVICAKNHCLLPLTTHM